MKRLTQDQIKYAEQLLVLEEFEPSVEDAELRFVADDGTISDLYEVPWTPGLQGRASVVPQVMMIFAQRLSASQLRQLQTTAGELEELLEEEQDDEDQRAEWHQELFQTKTQLKTGEELVLSHSDDGELKGAFVWLPLAGGDEYSEMIVMDSADVDNLLELWAIGI